MTMLEITLVRSTINRPYKQERTVRALGFTRLHQTRLLPDNACTRGMIGKISHLVTWREVPGSTKTK